MGAEHRWQLVALEAIDELARLAHDWDGYGSPDIHRDVLALSRSIVRLIQQVHLPSPHVGPESGGALQIEWRVQDRELELHVLPGESVELVASRDGELVEAETWQVPTAQALAELAGRVVRWLEG